MWVRANTCGTNACINDGTTDAAKAHKVTPYLQPSPTMARWPCNLVTRPTNKMPSWRIGWSVDQPTARRLLSASRKFQWAELLLSCRRCARARPLAGRKPGPGPRGRCIEPNRHVAKDASKSGAGGGRRLKAAGAGAGGSWCWWWLAWWRYGGAGALLATSLCCKRGERALRRPTNSFPTNQGRLIGGVC